MDKETLVTLCLALSVVGILCLYVAVQFYQAPDSSFDAAAKAGEGEKVNVKGIVLNQKKTDKMSTISLGYYDSLNVVVFNDGVLSLAVGQNIRVRGRIQQFNGKNEIVADDIKILNGS